MIRFRKDFTAADVIGKQARVYYNLHKHCWSVQVGGIVVAHTDSVLMRGVTGKVSQAGRERVLREGKKNVHAFICGQIEDMGSGNVGDRLERGPQWQPITYNPKRYRTFVYRDTEAPFYKAAHAYLDDFRRVFVA